jgi:hypothetical protein
LQPKAGLHKTLSIVPESKDSSGSGSEEAKIDKFSEKLELKKQDLDEYLTPEVDLQKGQKQPKRKPIFEYDS